VVDRLWRKHAAEGLRVVAVDVEGRELEPVAAELVRSLGLGLPVALGGDAVAERYQVDRLPHLAILDGEGRVRRVLLGAHAERELEAAVREVLGGGR
jgi:hypothetical protein